MKGFVADREPNITLKNLSEIKISGLILSLKKLKNELFNRKKMRNRLKTVNVCKTSKYSPMVSVIICTADREELAFNAVKSVLSQRFEEEKYEVILVNNSKNPIREEFKNMGIKIVDEPVKGISQARNSGANTAKGEYLLYIDDDAEAYDGLILNIFNAFESHKDCAIIGGQIFLEIPTPCPKVFLKGNEALWSGYTVSYKNFKEINEQYEFPYGACFGMRHSILDAFGGFPTDYGRCGNDYAGGEETALCFMAKNSRLKIGIEPKAAVKHKVSVDRFTKEHIKETIRAGILTTVRLGEDGYCRNAWTVEYVDERIKIIKKELERLKNGSDNLRYFYKECELYAFEEAYEILSKTEG